MPTKPSRPRPNPKRQFLWALVALVGVGGSYAVGLYFQDKSPPPEKPEIRQSAPEEGKGKPWYLSHSAPPAMVTAPDTSIFPDSHNGEPDQPVRPYEEALPEEIYEAPAVQPVLTPPPQVPRKPAAPKPEPAPTPPAAASPPQPVVTPPAAPAPEAVPVVPVETAALPPPGESPAPVLIPPEEAVPGEALPAWRRFAMAVPATAGHPMIAVIIDDMGIDRRRSAQAAAFSKPLTLSFLAYARNLAKQAATARAAGHELLLHVPMEPRNRKLDAGPDVLLVDIEPDELRKRLNRGLDRFDSFVGINNHMGSRFTADPVGMTIVMEELKRRGLLFLDSRTTGGTVGPMVARRFGVPFAQRNIFLDNVNEIEAVNARLRDLEGLARRNGFAIAIAHPRDATLKALAVWLDEVETRGFVLVPLSTVVLARRGAG